MKIIQLNAWNFAFLDKMIEFLKAQSPDIINLQEVGTAGFRKQKEFSVDPFEILKKELKMDGHFAPTSGVRDENGLESFFGNGFLTKLEILDYGSFTDRFLPDFVWYSEKTSPISAKDHTVKQTYQEKKATYEAAYELPANFVWGILKYKNNIIRNITSHFSVSFKCTETLQMVRQSRQVVDFLKKGKEIPTIFSGDLNITKDSVSIKSLESIMKNVSGEFTNTLDPSVHMLFQYQNEGLAVDHIFQKGFEVISCTCPEVGISDHLPLVAELSITNEKL